MEEEDDEEEGGGCGDLWCVFKGFFKVSNVFGRLY